MAPRSAENDHAGLSPKAIVCVCWALCARDGRDGRHRRHVLIDWEAQWAESGTALAIGMVVAAALAVIVLLVMKKNAERNVAC